MSRPVRGNKAFELRLLRGSHVPQDKGTLSLGRPSRCPSPSQRRGPVPNDNEPLGTARDSRSRIRSQTPGPKATKPESLKRINTFSGPLQERVPVSKDRASRSPDRSQTPGPKATEPESSDRASTCPGPSVTQGSVSQVFESVSSDRTYICASPLQTQGPVLKVNEPVRSPRACRRPILLKPTKSRIPIRLHSEQERHAKILDDPVIPERRLQRKERKAEPQTFARQGPTALEIQLGHELDEKDRIISDLQEKLLHSEKVVSEQTLLLAKDNEHTEQLKSELSMMKAENHRVHMNLEIANQGLELATARARKYVEGTAALESELKEARHLIGNLQRQQEVALAAICEIHQEVKDANVQVNIQSEAEAQLTKDVGRIQTQLEDHQKELSERSDTIRNLQQSELDLKSKLEKTDKLFKQVINELAVRDEEFRNLFQTLKFKHTQLRKLEDSVKLLEERYERSSLIRAKLEEKNAALQEKTVRLKNNLRYYSQIIIGNDGKPFFEAMPPTSTDPNNACKLVPEPEQESNQAKGPNRRKN